jgi:disulfide bond formation protein DsbB
MIKWRSYAVISFMVSFMAICSAFIAQYFFDVQPCLICIYQRYMWGGMMIIALLFLIFSKKNSYQTVVLASLAFSICLLSNYQVLIEEKILPAPQACRSLVAANLSACELIDSFQSTPNRPPCDKEPYRVFGLSFAAYGGISAAILSFIGFFVWFKTPKKRYFSGRNR